MTIDTFRTIVCATMLLLVGTKGYSQAISTNIFDGYLITEKNDTLKGELDVSSTFLSLTPNALGFRKKTDYEFKKYYSTSELKKVVVYTIDKEDSILFLTKKVKFYQSNGNSLLQSVPFQSAIDTTLLVRAYVLGHISLYCYHDDLNQPYYFIEKKGKAIESLIDAEKTKKQFHLDINQDFRSKLSLLFKDCSNFKHYDFKNFKFKEAALIHITDEYNHAMSKESIPYIVAQSPRSFHYGLTVGAHYTSVTQNGWTHTNSTITPSIGAWVSKGLFKQKRLTFYGELAYTQLNTKVERYHTITVLRYLDSAEVQLHYIRFNSLIGYDFAKIKTGYIYTKVGASVGLLFQNKTQQSAFVIDDLLRTKLGTDERVYRPIELGLLGAIGVQFKRLSIESRLGLSNGYSNTNMVKTIVYNASLNFYWALSNMNPYVKSNIK
jgi:Outer membrane protein beta-barrel domain